MANGKTAGLLAVLLGAVAAFGIGLAAAQNSGAEVRIEARRLGDGRVEFALSERGTDGEWGDRILPSSRYFPTGSRGRWLRSSPVSVGAGAPAPTVRIEARRLGDGRIEFALSERGTDGAWGDRVLPSSRYFPTGSRGRWLRSSPVFVGASAPAVASPSACADGAVAVADVSATHIQHPPPLAYFSGSDRSAAGLAWSPDGRKIAFVSDRDADGSSVARNIYVMNADGSGVERLTLFGIVGWADQPAWSPDGRRIAFHAREHGNAVGVYVMNADGSGVERLTYSDATDENPVWSPDGRRIAFVSARDGDYEIYVMNADGSGVERLTYSTYYGKDANMRSYDHEPAWSPDGRRIAFVSGRDGNHEIYVMNADGSGVERLTFFGGMSWATWGPAWSPDGRGIAFSWQRRNGGWEIYAVNADGSGGGCLAYSSDQPAWSPDGRRLAFGSGQYGDGWGIYAMNADGSGVERLTSASAPSDQPAWSPDGQRIAFVSRHGGKPAIYVVAVDARPR